MSENKYIASPHGDMAILFDNVFGANFTRMAINQSLADNKRSWVRPLFSNKNDARIFQDILINYLSVDGASVEALGSQLGEDMYYEISQAVLLRLRDDLDEFLGQSQSSIHISGANSILIFCGLGCAGVPLLYNSYNQSMTVKELVAYLKSLSIESPDTLKIYMASNASAAQSNNILQNMNDLFSRTSLNTFGVDGSLAAEFCSALSFESLFKGVAVYGYQFPILTQGTEACGVDEITQKLNKWKSLTMASLVPVYTEDKKYYQRVPVRRSLTKVQLTSPGSRGLQSGRDSGGSYE